MRYHAGLCLASGPHLPCELKPDPPNVSPNGLSVRKGTAGSPFLLKKFGEAASLHAKRTAVGLDTCGLETMTVLPWIRALAATNLPSTPAIVNQFSGLPSFAVNPLPT